MFMFVTRMTFYIEPKIYISHNGLCLYNLSLHLITIWAGWNYYNSRQFLLQFTAEFGGITIQGSFYCNSGQILQVGSIITIQGSTRPLLVSVELLDPDMSLKCSFYDMVKQQAPICTLCTRW